MTDKKLLELAAKAAGITGFWVDSGLNTQTDATPKIWNPLIDDGDALRLAVKLEMQVVIGFRMVEAAVCSDSDEPPIRACEPKVGDICAAIRRAIVRAAAQIIRSGT